ncbi:ABC transporter permease [Spirochaetes bacterium]|uniref:ABC transporter permease n=1 Tax=Candidatus Scatousia excrementipullorum TaxID=2840936 RepID=A0A9D9H010_9BACT|nr:ABC transporter permease [Candidatus Scatousia excrementipullorum]
MIKFFGLCVQNLIRSLKYLFTGQMRFESVITQAVSIGYDSLPISLIIAFIAAAVIAIQVAKQFLMTGAEAYIGGTIAIVMIREIAPGFVALAIGARAGTAISAEIANMQVTSQVDAIKTLKVDPVGYYFTPRLAAAAITVPMVVLLAEIVGVAGGLLVSKLTIGLHPNRYMYSVWAWLATKDIYISLLKASVFGILIALVCATQGYETKGGAKEVGTSTTQAAILSTIYILFADFIINLIFYIAK